VQAPPGSGKTTRVAPYLASRENGHVIVLEPRRLAARLAAQRVAEERNESIGKTVGYHVRFDSTIRPCTRIHYVTDGVFVRQLLANPSLDGIETVVIDEFHERRLNTDWILGWLLNLQRTLRHDLKVVVMSATLDSHALTRYLEPCSQLQTQGKQFDVAISFSNTPDSRPLALRVASAVRSLAQQGLDGHLLVFLPGAAEIRETQRACEPIAERYHLDTFALHGSMPSEEQDRAVAPSATPKIILSTNVAESSITIEGIAAVIDSGLARVAGHAPWSGLPTLNTLPISKASAIQRAGRAGRTRHGQCIRLFSEADWMRRPDHDLPEIQRADLAEVALVLRGLGIQSSDAFPWLDPPAPNAWAAAETLLGDLGALRHDGSLSETGQQLLRFPVHPRIARILLESERRGVADQTATAAALMTEKHLMTPRRFSSHAHQGPHRNPSANLIDALDHFHGRSARSVAERSDHAPACDDFARRELDKVRRALLSVVHASTPAPANQEEAVACCVLTGYPDRVARKVRGRLVTLTVGGNAWVDSEEENVPNFLVAIDAQQSQEGMNRRLIVRSYCAIDPWHVLDLFPDRIEEMTEYRWNESTDCVETIERWLYRGLVLDETRLARVASEQASHVLAEHVLALGPHAFAPERELTALLGRVDLLRKLGLPMPALDMRVVHAVLREICEGKQCLSQVREAGLMQALQGMLSSQQRQMMELMAPKTLRLPCGKELEIHYEVGQPPWAASRLQDFFGMTQSPRVAEGKVAVTLHLLAPNQRAVQVTQDLESFWSLHYPKLRGQLSRRYPKHAWPEDGRKARPPAPGRLR